MLPVGFLHQLFLNASYWTWPKQRTVAVRLHWSEFTPTCVLSCCVASEKSTQRCVHLNTVTEIMLPFTLKRVDCNHLSYGCHSNTAFCCLHACNGLVIFQLQSRSGRLVEVVMVENGGQIAQGHCLQRHIR